MRTAIAAGAATALILLAAATAAAQEMPKPSPEMANLDFFEGSWTCEGTTHPGPFGPGGKITSTARIQDDLGGFWQSGTVKGSMAKMPPFEGRFHTTYDPGGKQFVMLWVDNMGGWSRTTSSGWQGDRIVFEGDANMPGQKPMKSRDVFTRAAEGSMKHVWEMQMDGKWTTAGEENCRKSAK